jgi:hypothetical protein
VSSICLFFFIFELIASTTAKTKLRLLSTSSPSSSSSPPSVAPSFLSQLTSLCPYTLVIEGYLFSFFFWLDLIAILSMFPDINWIAKGIGIAGVAASVSSTNNSFSKAGRVVRTVRLARLVRIYKIQSERKRLERIEQEQMELVRQGVLTYEDVIRSRQINQERNSKVGAELSDTITRRVIIIVLLMLCLVPVLNYTAPDKTQHYSTRLLHQYNVHGDENTRALALNDFMKFYKELEGSPYCIRLQMEPYLSDYYVNDRHSFHTLRHEAITEEAFKFVDTTSSSGNTTIYRTTAWFNNQYAVEEVALNGILLTIFVSLVMLIGTVTFTTDVETLVLKPIQRMMNMVEQVAKDPLSPLVFNSESTGEYERWNGIAQLNPSPMTLAVCLLR